MNPLPTGPLLTQKDIQQYFRDMKRWNFDIAYNAFYAYPYSEVIGKFRKPYIDFAKKAHKRGLIACLQIQSTVAYLEDIPLTEAQLYLDNSPHLYAHYRKYGKKNFFASFSSKTWLKYLEKLTKLFVQDYGYDWIVYEEPMWIVDIPGKRDLFYNEFLRRYPDLPYPTKNLETPSYVAVQKLKQDILVEFYDKLTLSARKIGVQQIGIMPWFFTPTHENTPAETFHSPCPTDRIIFLPNLDFVIVRMQPDNIYAGAMESTHGENLPRLYYLESMAHAIGKPVIVVNNPTNEHPTREHPEERLIPLEYFTRSTLSIAASTPQGMTRHWYKKHYSKDTKHMQLMTKVNAILPKLGYPQSPMAFVYSYRAHWHTLPLKAFEVWKNYWNFAQNLFFPWETETNNISIPMKTFYSESISECLDRNPDVQILIFNEYFPLTDKEVKIVEKWWEEKPGRTILYFGTGNGYSVDERNSGESHRTPEILHLFGIKSNYFVEQVTRDFGIDMEFIGKNIQNHFLDKHTHLPTQKIGKYHFDGNAAEILYRDSDSKTEIISQKINSTGNLALFFNFDLLRKKDSSTIEKVTHYILNQLNINLPIVKTTPGILWNQTLFGYLILSNLRNQLGYVVLVKKGYDFWNVLTQEWISLLDDTILINPLDFQLVRLVKNDNPFIDINGMTKIHEIINSNQKIQINLFTQQEVTVLLRNSPKNIYLNDKQIKVKPVHFQDYCKIEIPCPTGFHKIRLEF